MMGLGTGRVQLSRILEARGRALIGTSRGRILALGFLAVSLVVVTFGLTGAPFSWDYSTLLDRGIVPDVLHERATAWETVWGDPYRPSEEILADHGIESAGGLSPRPPAALMLQAPLALVPEPFLMPVVLSTILSLLMWIGVMTYQISRAELGKLLMVAPLLVISLPIVATISYSPLFSLVAVALTVAAWRYQDNRWAGILLGVAIALRVWPAVVALGFWIAGKRKLAVSSLAVALLLNVIAVLLPVIALEKSVESLLLADSNWLNHNMNASLGLFLWPYGVPAWAAGVLAIVVGVFLAIRRPSNAVPIAITTGLIASPLSWPTYALAALPVLALSSRRRSVWFLIAIGAALACWSLLPARWLGHSLLFGLCGLLVLSARDAPDSPLEASMDPA